MVFLIIFSNRVDVMLDLPRVWDALWKCHRLPFLFLDINLGHSWVFSRMATTRSGREPGLDNSDPALGYLKPHPSPGVILTTYALSTDPEPQYDVWTSWGWGVGPPLTKRRPGPIELPLGFYSLTVKDGLPIVPLNHSLLDHDHWMFILLVVRSQGCWRPYKTVSIMKASPKEGGGFSNNLHAIHTIATKLTRCEKVSK